MKGPGPESASDLVEASSVILLRDGPDGLETFVVLRHARSSSFADMLVFPGGQVDAADAAPEIAGLSADLGPEEAARRLGSLAPPERAMAHLVAGVRELFEEAGVLLALDSGGNPDLSDRRPALAELRAALNDQAIDLPGICRRLDVRISPGSLSFFAHWITPVGAPKRFDTRFFLAGLPPGQEPSHDGRETSAGEWLAPAAALERYRRGEAQLVPPTFVLLSELERIPDVASAHAMAREREVVTILPRWFSHGGGVAFLYPGDVAYEGGDPDQPGRRRRLVTRDGLFHEVLEG